MEKVFGFVAFFAALLAIPLFTEGLIHLVTALRKPPEENVTGHVTITGLTWGFLVMGVIVALVMTH